jgi:hypothetical protein
MDDYDRVLETVLREYQREIATPVEREFARLRELPDGVGKLPWIGGEYYREQHAEQMQRVTAALGAKCWFEYEASLWAQPLPLKLEDCHKLFNQPNRRLWPVGRYGIELRGMGWDYRRAPPRSSAANELAPAG